MDQGGLRNIWLALTWSMVLPSDLRTAHAVTVREPVHAVLGLMTRPDGTQLVSPPSAHPCIIAALTLLFSDFLPRDHAAGNAREWRMREVLNAVTLCVQLSGTHLHPELQRPLLLSWPHALDGMVPTAAAAWYRRHAANPGRRV